MHHVWAFLVRIWRQWGTTFVLVYNRYDRIEQR